MTLTQLECFLSVAGTRHFGRAAQRLGKTQPALSIHIQRLEAELGVTLFERTGRQVSLTGAAELLAPHAERLLHEAEDINAIMQEVKGGLRGRIRLGILPTVAAHFLPPVLKRFRPLCPKVEVLIREERVTADLLPPLLRGEIDIAVGLERADTGGIRSVALIHEELCLAVSRDHPLAGRSSVAVRQLAGERFILYKSPGHRTRESTIDACRQAGFEPSIAVESEQAETIQYLVAANLGVTFLPEMVLRHGRDKGLAQIRLRRPTPARTIVAAWKTGRYVSATAKHFLTCAKEMGDAWNRR